MSTIKSDNIATLAGVSTSMANAVNGSAKAWVNFNGTGTVAIRRAFNVSTITDNGTGDYTVNFTTAMVDADYSANVTADVGGVADFAVASTGDNSTARTTSLVRTRIGTTGGSPADSTIITVSIFS